MRTTNLLVMLLVAPFVLAAAPVERETGQVEKVVTRTHKLQYLVHTPTDYDAEGEPLPLLLFLHGAGERGSDLDKLRGNGLLRHLDKGIGHDAIIVSPQCPAESSWTQEVPALVALLDKIEGEYNVDRDRIYITGLSMGGYGTFALAAAARDRVAAIVPICGGGEMRSARLLSRMPAWVFHGGADELVPVEESERMVRFMNRSGGEHAKLTVYPGVGHDSWTPTYNDPAMWDWLFSQRLSHRTSTTTAPQR